MKRRPYKRAGRPAYEIFPPDTPQVPDTNRAETRLAGEVWDALEQGYIVPLPILRWFQTTMRAWKG